MIYCISTSKIRTIIGNVSAVPIVSAYFRYFPE